VWGVRTRLRKMRVPAPPLPQISLIDRRLGMISFKVFQCTLKQYSGLVAVQIDLLSCSVVPRAESLHTVILQMKSSAKTKYTYAQERNRRRPGRDLLSVRV
jgi:hypothetical protein